VSSNFDDVRAMHAKFGMPIGDEPKALDDSRYKFRRDFMWEELDEFDEAQLNWNLAGMADALVDLVWVAMGAAVEMGLPWQALWDEVGRANMRKELGHNGRGTAVDLRKPDGWRPPDIEGVLRRART